jgi:integrase
VQWQWLLPRSRARAKNHCHGCQQYTEKKRDIARLGTTKIMFNSVFQPKPGDRAKRLPSVFVIPGAYVNNREDRLVVLNSIARGVIEQQRDRRSEYVFLNSRGNPVQKMCREAWRTARRKAGLPDVRIHDLKHTFGTRLRHAGVSFEDRQDLLGHKSGRITTHYSAPELMKLIEASERVCGDHWHNGHFENEKSRPSSCQVSLIIDSFWWAVRDSNPKPTD